MTPGHPQGQRGELRVGIVALSGAEGRTRSAQRGQLLLDLRGQLLARTLTGTGLGRIAAIRRSFPVIPLRLQAPHLFLRDRRTMIGPATRAALPSQQTHGQRFNQRLVRRIAEAIEKEKDQGDRVGVRQSDAGLSHDLGGLRHRPIVRRHAALQQSQSGQGGGADLRITPGAVGALQTPQCSYASINGPFDGVRIDGASRVDHRCQHDAGQESHRQ